VKRLTTWYIALAKKKSATEETVTIEDVERFPGFGLNPFVSRVFEVIVEENPSSARGSDEVLVEDLFLLLSVFHANTDITFKQEYMFKCVDADRDGYVSFGDLTYFYSILFPIKKADEIGLRAQLVFDSFKLMATEKLSSEQIVSLFDQASMNKRFDLIK